MSIIVEPSFVEGQKASFAIHLDLSAVGRSVDTSYSGLQNLNLFIYTVTVAVFVFSVFPVHVVMYASLRRTFFI